MKDTKGNPQGLKRMRKKVFDGGFSAVAFAGAEARR
jgi:hypothetical protein